MTRVVKPDELGKPNEKLKVQMRKLTQESENTCTIQFCALYA